MQLLEKFNLKKPDINEMTDHEILLELIQDKRRNDRNRYIKNGVRIVIAIAVIVLLIIIVPPIVRFFKDLNETITQVEESIAQVTEVTDNVKTQIEESLSQIGNFADDAKAQIEESIDEFSSAAEDVKEQVSQSLDDFNGLYDELKESVDQIGTDGLESIREAADNLNDILNSIPDIFK